MTQLEKFENGSNKLQLELDKIGVSLSDAVMIPTNQIRRMAGQPRLEFSEDDSLSIRTSIRLIGQLQDGLIRQLTEEEIESEVEVGSPVRYELIDGERRFRACKELERDFKAKIATGVTPDIQYLLSVSLNFNRVNHSPGETVLVIKNMLSNNYTPPQIAEVIGISSVTVYKYKQLLGLDERILERLGPPTPKDKRLGVQVAFELTKIHIALQHAVFLRLGEGPTIQRAKSIIKSVLEKNEAAANPDLKNRPIEPNGVRKIIERLTARAVDATNSIPGNVLEKISLEDGRSLVQKLNESIGSLTKLREGLEKKVKL